jgi:hypothetical protein
MGKGNGSDIKLINLLPINLKHMKKTAIRIMVFSLCLPAYTIAQPAPEIIRQFPAYIAHKIHEVTARINLTPEKQMELGKYFLKQDKLANESLSKSTDLGNFYSLNYNNLLHVLSPFEVNDFFADDYSVNKISLALKYRDKLKLNDGQITQLLKQNEIFESLAATANKAAFVKKELSNILNREQYKTLLVLIYHQQALADTRADWNKLKLNKLVSPKDSNTLFTRIYDYYIDSKSKPEYLNLANNWRRADSLRAAIELSKPDVLLKQNIADNTLFRKNQLSEILKNEKQLGLSKVQADSLFTAYKQLELERISYNMRYTEITYNVKPFEYEQIHKILTLPQITSFFEIKHKNLAQDNALTDWEKAVQLGITQGLQKQQALKELTAYQLKWLVATDHININRNEHNISARRNIELHRPLLLKKTDELLAGNPKQGKANVADNRFSQAISYRDTLGLSNNQLDSLLKQKTMYEALPATANKNAFVKEQLVKTLTPEQSKLFLGILYHPQAIANAKTDWENLRKNKLVSASDSSTLFPAIYNYHTDSKSKPEYIVNANNQRKADSLRTVIELSKPAVLLKLNILENTVFRKNQFSEIIRNAERLVLSKEQQDTLLLRYKEVEEQRIAYNVKYLEIAYNVKPFEYEQIRKILTPAQSTAYLEIKNTNLAKDNAVRDWEKAEQIDLTKGMNKESTLAELADYQLRWLVATDQINIHRNQRNAFIRRDIELKKPDLLKKLDAVASQAATTATTKNALIW